MRLFDTSDMDKADKDPKIKQKYGISDKAVEDFKRDLKKIQQGTLKSPSPDFKFVWGKSGERKLFRGVVDPVS